VLAEVLFQGRGCQVPVDSEVDRSRPGVLSGGRLGESAQARVGWLPTDSDRETATPERPRERPEEGGLADPVDPFEDQEGPPVMGRHSAAPSGPTSGRQP